MDRILLVDDDGELRAALQAALTSHGYRVFSASDGIAALRAAAVVKPDVIVSDVNMPLLEGPDAVRILKALPMFRRVRVILMSGAELPMTGQAHAAVRKPVTPERLIQLIEELPRTTGLTSVPMTCIPQRATALDQRWDAALAVASLGEHNSPECAVLICRGIELMHEQAFRIGRLRRLGLKTGESEQLYDRLVESVATLIQVLAVS